MDESTPLVQELPNPAIAASNEVIPVEKREVADRVTVVETVYFNNHNDQPISYQSGFACELETKEEQPYIRHSKAGEEWQPLDMGWLNDKAGIVVVQNEEGKNPPVKLSDAEKESLAAKVLEVSSSKIDSFVLLLPPGESLRIRTLSQLSIRSRSGKTKFVVCAMPR